jgi:hypothetical protein
MTFLIEGEHVIKRFGHSRIVQIKLYLAALVLFLIPAVYFLYFSSVALPFDSSYLLVAGVIGAIVALIAEMKTRLGSYYITNYRVVSIRGAMKKTTDSCTYDKIASVNIEQTFPQRILRMGTVNITTNQRAVILLESVSNPTKIERLIYNAMKKQTGERQAEEKPSEQPPYEPERQVPYQSRPQEAPARRPESRGPAEQSGYGSQNRPLLASERRAMEQSGPPQQPHPENPNPARPMLAAERRQTYRETPERQPQQPEPQAKRKKRFGLF